MNFGIRSFAKTKIFVFRIKKKEKDTDKEEEYEPIALGYQYGNSPPYLMNFKGPIGERHEENKEIIEFESFSSYAKHLEVITNDNKPQNIQLINAMKYILSKLNGVDIFWEGQCVSFDDDDSDSHTDNLKRVQTAVIIPNQSKTKFGKLYIIPFPFCAVFVSDDDDKTKTVFSISPVIAGKKFDSAKGIQNLFELVRQNASNETMRRREVRLKLRAMEGSMCHWPLQKRIRKTVSKTTGTGKNRRTQSKTITVTFSFKNGCFGIDRNGAKAIWTGKDGKTVDVTRGFGAHLQYRDGTGRHSCSGWHPSSWQNEPYKALGEDFGLNDLFQDTPQFAQFMRQNYKHEAGKQQVIKDFKSYCDHYKNEFLAKERTLSYAFWYFVYNNDGIKQSVLEKVMRCESNEKLLKLVNDGAYMESVNMVFEKLKFFNKDKKHSFWFIFFHDLWINNMLMPIFAENEALLSPYQPTSLCYRYIEDKNELIKLLEEKKLCGKETKLRKGWINRTMIDQLYARLYVIQIEMETSAMNKEHQRFIEIEMCPLPKNDDEYLEQYQKAATLIQTMCCSEDYVPNANAPIQKEEEEKKDDA